MKILAQSKNFIIQNEYESVFLTKKGSKIIIGDFYGDPKDAIIDFKERWGVVVGCGLIIYYFREPFEAYSEKKSSQWDELFRTKDDEWWIETVYQVSENEIRFVVDPNSEYRELYQLDVSNLKYQKLF